MYLRRQEKQQDTARGAFYRMYSDKEYSGSADGAKKALYEAAKGFFNRKRTLGPVVAFRRSVNESVKPEWLLWAISPALNQTDHSALRASVCSDPIAPPWSE
jgi:hypothetical protein